MLLVLLLLLLLLLLLVKEEPSILKHKNSLNPKPGNPTTSYPPKSEFKCGWLASLYLITVSMERGGPVRMMGRRFGSHQGSARSQRRARVGAGDKVGLQGLGEFIVGCTLCLLFTGLLLRRFSK